jgi:hypothetical protein
MSSGLTAVIGSMAAFCARRSHQKRLSLIETTRHFGAPVNRLLA